MNPDTHRPGEPARAGDRVTVPSQELDLLRGPAWKNRLTLAPMTNQQSSADGCLGDDEYAWLVRRAEGGFGMVMTCAAHVAPEGQAFPGQLGVFDDRHLDGLCRLASGLREVFDESDA